MTEDITRTKAEALVEQINSRVGLSADLFYDRGPYCARIPLTPARSDGSPSLFVFLEDTDDYRILPTRDSMGLTREKRGWRWRGVIGGDGVSVDLQEVTFEFLERDWLGEDVGTVADRVRAIAQRLLTNGITSWA